MGDNNIILVDKMYNIRKIYGNFEGIIDENIMNLRNISDTSLYSVLDLGLTSLSSSSETSMSFDNILIGENQNRRAVNIGFDKVFKDEIFAIEIRGLNSFEDDGENDDEKIRNVFKIAVGELKKTNSKLRHLAYYDNLTNLPNRVFMYEKLNEYINHNKGKVGVLVIDLDRFKTINDTLGHHVGDQIIVEVSKRLLNIVKQQDLVGRIGGDEFAMIVPNISRRENIEDVCEMIRFEFKKNFEFKGVTFNMNVSIGASIYPDDALDYENIIKNADMAMHRVKAKGGNGYEFYNKNIKKSFALKMEIENKLKNAIKNNEMKLLYQPQVDIKEMKVRSCEALLRWNNKELGDISPSKFIPVAEETGLIKNLGNWVINQVFSQIKRWNEEGLDISVSLNVSPIQFHKQDIFALMKKSIELYDIDPRFICLEITEGISFLNEDYAFEILRKLKGLGLKIAIDDFGVGYSSLNYIRRFPIDEIKVDKVFINDIETSSNDRSIVETTLYLAKKLNIDTVVEGVETDEQYNIIKTMKCDKIQGYYFSKPLDTDEFEEFLKSFQKPPIKC